MYARVVTAGLALARAVQAQSDTAPPPGDFYSGNNLAVIQDSDTVSKAFPKVDIELRLPYFLNRDRANPGFANSTKGPISLTELDYFVRSIADRNDWITYRPADYTSEEGRPLLYVFLLEASLIGAATNSTKLKVCIQAAIYGNEPAADEGALALLGKMEANWTWTASLLEKMDILLLPRWNADGVAYFQRRTASNLDPNREAVKLDRQQSRDI
ncbi:putative peptidase M14, carboxypeptidase A [Septoria linicola]|nr:putative peptidase M14, carboxypeptidase A [Septoria linicola]